MNLYFNQTMAETAFDCQLWCQDQLAHACGIKEYQAISLLFLALFGVMTHPFVSDKVKESINLFIGLMVAGFIIIYWWGL